MGGYLLLNIEFPNKLERDKFEKQENMRRMFQYWNQKDDGGINYYDCFYYPSYIGYAEPQDIIKRCRNKIKINKFLSIDLSINGSWYDEIKEKSYEEEEE